jgi:hypothetical protein
MSTLFKCLVLLVLWQTGILGQILIVVGGIIIWVGAVLQPNYFGVF